MYLYMYFLVGGGIFREQVVRKNYLLKVLDRAVLSIRDTVGMLLSPVTQLNELRYNIKIKKFILRWGKKP